MATFAMIYFRHMYFILLLLFFFLPMKEVPYFQIRVSKVEEFVHRCSPIVAPRLPGHHMEGDILDIFCYQIYI